MVADPPIPSPQSERANARLRRAQWLVLGFVFVGAIVSSAAILSNQAAIRQQGETLADILREDRADRAAEAARVEDELAERAVALQQALDEVERRNAAQIAAADQRDQERYEALFEAIGAPPPPGVPPTPLVTPPPEEVVTPPPPEPEPAPQPGPGARQVTPRSAPPAAPPPTAPPPPPRPGNPPPHSNRPPEPPGQAKEREVDLTVDLPILPPVEVVVRRGFDPPMPDTT